MRRSTWRIVFRSPDLAVLAAVACIATLLAGCATPRAAVRTSPAEAVESVERRQRSFFAAVAARDPDAVAGFFAADATMHVANMPPLEGREAIRALYGNMFGFMTGSSASPETLRIAASGDLAYGTGATTNEFRGPEGPASYAGKYTIVWRNVDGEWLVAVYAISSNQAPPGR